MPGVWKRGYVSGNDYDTFCESKLNWWPKMPWENFYWKDEKLGATGFASYRLKIIFPPGYKKLAFKIEDEGTAYSFFINDSLAASNGKVGTSKETSIPQYNKQLVVKELPVDTATLTFWISNYHYRKGGLWKSVIIGDSNLMTVQESNNHNLTLFIAGVWFMASFTLLFFFLYRPKERSVMFLLLWAFSSLIRMISSDDRIITGFFPGIGFGLLLSLELISLYFMVFSGTNTVFSLFPEEASKKVTRIFNMFFILVITLTVLTRPFFYTNFVVPFQFIALIVIVYSNIVMVKAMLRKRDGAWIIGSGWILMSAVFFLQVPYYNQLYNFSINMYTAYAFILAFLQILLLAKMFSGALSRIENFAGELEKTVEERTAELLRTQEQLVEIARQTENENIRRRISQDIHDDISSGLNKIAWLGERMKIKARKNKTEEFNAILDKIIISSRETVDHLIEIIWSLNPKSDDLETLFAYMRNYINRFFEDTSFNVIINFPELDHKVELNPELRRNLFLVLKEAIHNAAKYSNASEISISFRYDKPGYFFIIADNGIGIEEGIIKGTGNGMINMRKRMEDIKGEFSVESVPGAGTKIILKGAVFQ